jgi:hypothetical protein
MLGASGPARGRKHRFHLRTRYRRLDGEIESMSLRLIDVLNRDDLQRGLIATSFQASGVGTPDDRSDHAIIRLESVLLAVPIEEPGSPPPGDPFARIRKKPVRMEVGIGPYSLSGDVFLVDGSDPRDVMVLIQTRFFAMANVTLRHVDEPELHESHPVVFVNRELVDYTLPQPAARLAGAA